jgi:Protein phosphatase 2C
MIVTSNSWRLLSATATGSRHSALGLGSDDAIGSLQFDDGSWIVVIADGAGSARHASEGSDIAVKHGTQFLSNHFARTLEPNGDSFSSALRDCAFQTRNAILEKATESGTPIEEFATTFIAICATPHVLAVLQIGDGGVVIRQGAEPLSLVFTPSHGEYINETFFLTSPGFLEHTSIITVPAPDVDRIAAFTDGVAFLGINMKQNRPHISFFDPLFEFAKSDDADSAQLKSFLESEQVCKRTDDDKTLFIAIRNDTQDR